MTQREKELFISENFENLPKLGGNSYYLVRYIIYFNYDGTKHLYEDTEYVDHPNYYSDSSNYFLIEPTPLDNGNVPRKFLFDVTFLFEPGYVSPYGCTIGTPPPLTHSLSFIHNYDADNELDTWNIADNGFENSDYQVWKSSFFYDYYFVEVPHPDLYSEKYTSLYAAQNAVKNYYIRDGYPTLQGNSVYTKYYQPFRDYLDCLKTKVNQCCLKQCFN